MAIPTQGGLGQASAQTKPPVQAGGKFDADAVQAENLESQDKPTGLKEKVVDDLGDQREEMNLILLRLRAGLNDRKNRMFDPVLMQAGAGFLKPTKTGSFGESLGNAAEGAGVASEKELIHDRENQKLEMELAGKEMEFRQQLGGDKLVSQLLGGPKTGGVPSGTAVTTPTGGLRVAGQATPIDVTNADKNAQVAGTLRAAAEGRIKVTDEILLLANRVYPKLLPTLQEMRKSQGEEEKNLIEREKLAQTRGKIVPALMKTEREMNLAQQDAYQKALDAFNATGDEQAYLKFLAGKGWLDFDVARNYKIPKAGEQAEPIGKAKTPAELESEKETLTQTAKERATSAEQKASKLATMAEGAFANINSANDIIGYAKNNPKITEAMNHPGIFGAVARAAEQGISVGNFSVSVPAKTLLEANLTKDDLTALQMLAQKFAELQSRGRQLNRTPGEGSTSDYETKLLGSIYALPADSQRAMILKSEALILQSMFDEDRFKLWAKKSKQSGYTYNDFIVDQDYKDLKSEFKSTLDRVREENMDLLAPKKKGNAKTSSSTSAPASAPATTKTEDTKPAEPAPSANKIESPLEKFKREKAEREKKAQGTS
jgi:hypothetical protein